MKTEEYNPVNCITCKNAILDRSGYSTMSVAIMCKEFMKVEDVRNTGHCLYYVFNGATKITHLQEDDGEID